MRSHRNGHVFLSDSWFEEVELLRAEVNPEVPAAIKDLVINMVVMDGPDGDTEARMDSGRSEVSPRTEADPSARSSRHLARRPPARR